MPGRALVLAAASGGVLWGGPGTRSVDCLEEGSAKSSGETPVPFVAGSALTTGLSTKAERTIEEAIFAPRRRNSPIAMNSLNMSDVPWCDHRATGAARVGQHCLRQPHLTFPRLTLEAIAAPLSSQMFAFPLVLRQRMSALPSPSKSPTPAIAQVTGGFDHSRRPMLLE